MNRTTTLEEARQVCPTTTRRLSEEGALLVDVREAAEVARLAFDVPAIVHIPLFELEQRWAELPTDRDIVLVCDSGARSLKATYYLQFHGFTRVSNMDGGIVKWMNKGFPVTGQRHQVPAVATGCCGSAAGAEVAGACCTPASTAADSACCGSTPDATPARAGCC